jgi:hypothetical protein
MNSDWIGLRLNPETTAATIHIREPREARPRLQPAEPSSTHGLAVGRGDNSDVTEPWAGGHSGERRLKPLYPGSGIGSGRLQVQSKEQVGRVARQTSQLSGKHTRSRIEYACRD